MKWSLVCFSLVLLLESRTLALDQERQGVGEDHDLNIEIGIFRCDKISGKHLTHAR